MTRTQASCPNCSAPLTFRWSSAVQTTCAHCRSVVVRHDIDWRAIGEVSDLPQDSSPIQLGTEGRIDDRAFTVVGRIVYAYDDGGWNEWHLAFADGALPTARANIRCRPTRPARKDDPAQPTSKMAHSHRMAVAPSEVAIFAVRKPTTMLAIIPPEPISPYSRLASRAWKSSFARVQNCTRVSAMSARRTRRDSHRSVVPIMPIGSTPQ